VAIRSWRVTDTGGWENLVRSTRRSLGVVFCLVGVFSLIGFFDFTSSFPCHPSRIRLVTEMLGCPWNGSAAGLASFNLEAAALGIRGTAGVAGIPGVEGVVDRVRRERRAEIGLSRVSGLSSWVDRKT
jgi:hypothetical protein